MKNVIKRGTSLLLVLAMLLSFAAVVGAEEPTTPEKILTLTVANVTLKAGVNLIPVYASVKGNYHVSLLQFSAVSSNNEAVHIDTIYPGKPAGTTGTGVPLFESALDTVKGGNSTYSPEGQTPAFGWTSRIDGFTGTPTLPICYIKVTAKETVAASAYQINLCVHPDITDGCIFATFVSASQVTNHYENETTLNAGTAVAFPEGTDTTVFLTQDTFAAPTWENRESGGKYDLGDYLKIAKAEADGSVSIYPVDKSSLSITGNTLKGATLENNVLSVGTGVTNGDDTTLTVTAAQGGGISLSAPVTVMVKVSKEAPYRKYIGFGNNKTYGPAPTTTQVIEAEAYDVRPQSKYYALDAGHPATFDQYGVEMSEKAKLEVVLYSDETFTTKLSNTNEAYNYVAPGETKLQISNQLKKDVWCTVRPYVQAESERIYGGDADIAKVHIVSQYPQADKAIISLTDASGATASNTIEIPGINEADKTITYSVTSFIDQFGKTMTDNVPTNYTVSISPATTQGVDIDGNKQTITVSSAALAAVDKGPITISFRVYFGTDDTVGIPAYLSAEAAEAETPTATLTIKKADPIASSLASMENGTGDYQKSKILPATQDGNMPQLELPGIRSTDVTKLELAPLYALDQYEKKYATISMTKCFSLYKVNEDNTETKIDSDCVNFEKVGDTHVKLRLTNKLGTDGKVVLKEGTYKIKAEWSLTNDSPVLTASSAAFELKKAASVYTGEVDFFGQSTIYVPYEHGTLGGTKASSTVLGAILKDQYGETKRCVTSTVPEYTLSEIELNGKEVTDNAVTVAKAAGYSGGQIEIKLSPDAAKYFGDKEEINLIAKMEATVDGETVSGIPVKITVKKDASKLAHLKVTGTPNDGTAAFTKDATILDDDVTASFNLIVPNEGSRTYTIALSDVEDQYGTALTDKVSRAVETSGVTAADALKYDKATKTLTVRSDAAGGKAVLTFDESGTSAGHKVVLTLNFAKMSFVNGDGADYKVDMMLKTDERTYGQDNALTWAEVYDKIQKQGYPKVFIQGENNNLGDEVTDDVKVVIKQNDTEVFDSSKTYTEAPKANAGTYTIELIYVKDENTSYPIDSFTNFTINKATVTITANGTITKEYDGSPALPSGVTNDSFTKTGAYETVVVDESKLEYAQSDVKLGEDGKVTTIQIRLKSGETTCLKSGTDPAVVNNYNVNLSSLIGTITKRMVVVSPNFREFLYGENDKITEALSKGGTDTNAGFTYEAKTGTLPTGEKAPTFSGSMCLMNGTERLTIYNAGEYSIAQGDLTISSNYQIEWSQNDDNKTWLISPKTVDPFDVTLQAEYGINGSELYAMLNDAEVPVDGKEVNLSTVYNVNVLDIEDAGKNKVSRTGTDSVNAGEYTVTNWTLSTLGKNYTFNKVPTLKIKVKPHTLTPSDIHSTDNWKDKTYNGENQTFTNFEVSFKYNEGESNERTIKLVEGQDYVIVDNSNTGLSDVVHLRISAKEGNTNYTGTNVYAPDYWSILAFSLKAGDLEIYQTNTLTYNGTEQSPTLGVRILLKQEDDSDRYKVLQSFDITKNFGNLRDNLETNAGAYTGSGSFRGGFTAGGSKLDEFTWTIGKSDKTPIQNQTASTKYGQPGSKEISVSDGVKKGLDTSDLSVSVETDADSIIKGTPSVTFENGKIIVNWQLQGDATTIDKTATLSVTVAETDNYKPYTFDVVVTATKKLPQTGFGFTTATNVSVGYAEDTYNNPVQNAQTTPVYTSSKPSVATVDSSSGVVTILDVGETIITATAPEDAEYASDTVSYTLTVVPSLLTVTASSATMTANDPVPSFTASVTGLKSGQTAATVFQTLTASAATDGKTAGTYAVNASATLKADFVPRYTLRFVPGTLTVNPAQTAIDVVLPIIIGGNTCANGYANCACEIFYDLDASRWYHESIDWAYNLGLMNGTTKSTFGPNAAATRAQTWTMLARIAGQDTRRSSTWYEVGQKWAMNLGITDGTNPMGSLTREQLAAMLYRYVGSPAVNGTLTFTDSANVSTWARNAMIWAVQNGILDGVGGNRLNPKGTTTRAQAAAIFMRFSKLINK